MHIEMVKYSVQIELSVPLRRGAPTTTAHCRFRRLTRKIIHDHNVCHSRILPVERSRAIQLSLRTNPGGVEMKRADRR